MGTRRAIRTTHTAGGKHMHQAATCFRVIYVSALLCFFALAVPADATPADKEKTITIAEGTDVFVTLSPDHKTIIADLQGLLYSLPASGGQAKPITTPSHETSHPQLSPKSDLRAIQSHLRGPLHILTLHPHTP